MCGFEASRVQADDLPGRWTVTNGRWAPADRFLPVAKSGPVPQSLLRVLPSPSPVTPEGGLGMPPWWLAGHAET